MAARGTQIFYTLISKGLPSVKLIQNKRVLSMAYSSSSKGLPRLKLIQNKRVLSMAYSNSGLADYNNSKMLDKVLNSETMFDLDEYSKFAPAPISIQDFLSHGETATTRDSFFFLRKEIPTRMANMIMEIKLLPKSLLDQHECADILKDYIISFRELMLFENVSGSEEDVENFTEVLNMIRRRHLDTVPRMAQAVGRLGAVNAADGVNKTIQYFLDRLYTNRISIHMLISHYNALLGQKKNLVGMVGTIDPKCDVLDVCRNAYDAAAGICDVEYFEHPHLKVTALDTSDTNASTRVNVTSTLVPSHLHHILFEIFKNSMRATCEFSEKKNISELPYIRCRIFKTENDITIKISDLGGGIKRESSGKLFKYSYSTAPKVEVPGDGSYGAGLSADCLPMHGLGYGLPLSRLYARYFRGDITISSVDGYGTDVYVYLQRLSSMAQENLPVYNAKSSARLQSVATQIQDWTDIQKVTK